MQRIVSLDAEILSPELTLISVRENFSIPWTMPTFLMLSQHELGLPDLEAPNLYNHKFSVINLMPPGLDMTALLYGDQELPVALMIGPATGEIYQGTKGQVLAVVLKNTTIFDESEAESLDYAASFLSTRLVEVGRMISHVEMHRGTQLPNFAPSHLFAAIPRVTHDDIDRLFATLRMLLNEVVEPIDESFAFTMSKFATGINYSRQPVYESDDQFPCCDDQGVFSKAHSGVSQAMGELPGFRLNKEDFDMLPPCKANDDVPIKKLIKAPVGDAPRGFTKPPNNPIFAHLGYFTTAKVLTQVCLAAYLLSPQTLFNDNCSILHECKIGHSKRARNRIVFHHCGRFCCCDDSFPPSILASRCAYFRLHRKRVLLKIGAAFSATDPCYVERRQVLGHAGGKLMWFQIPRLNSLKMPVPSADRALYFQSVGLQPHEFRTSTDIMRLAFQSFIRKYPNGTLNNELDPLTTLCTIKHFLGRDEDYRAIPIMRPPSERHERQGVFDTIDDDWLSEVDLDNPKEILPTPLLWDRHAFSCLKPGSSILDKELLNEKLDSKHLKPDAAHPAVWANRILTGHDTMLRSMFQDPAVRCDCPVASNNRKYLDILTKESLAERATSSDVLGHFSDIEQIENSYSAWTPPTSIKVKNKRLKKKLNSDPEWSLPSPSSTMTRAGRGRGKERKKNARQGFGISPIKLFKLHSPVAFRRSPAENQSATDSEVSDTLNASLLSLTIPDKDDFTQTSSRSKKPKVKAENSSSNAIHEKTRTARKNDTVPSLSVQLDNLSSHALGAALGAVPRTVKIKYPSKNVLTGSARPKGVKKKDSCSDTVDPNCFDAYVPLPSLPFEELEDEIDFVTPAAFQLPTLSVCNNTSFKYPRTRSRDKQESRSITPESVRPSLRHRKK